MDLLLTRAQTPLDPPLDNGRVPSWQAPELLLLQPTLNAFIVAFVWKCSSGQKHATQLDGCILNILHIASSAENNACLFGDNCAIIYSNGCLMATLVSNNDTFFVGGGDVSGDLNKIYGWSLPSSPIYLNDNFTATVNEICATICAQGGSYLSAIERESSWFVRQSDQIKVRGGSLFNDRRLYCCV